MYLRALYIKYLDLDCVTSMMHFLFPFYIALVFGMGTIATFFSDRSFDHLGNIWNILYHSGPFIVGFVFAYWLFMKYALPKILNGMKDHIKCKVLILIWSGVSAVIGTLTLLPFYMEWITAYEQVSFVLWLTFVTLHVLSNMIVHEIPTFHLRYRDFWISVAFIMTINFALLIGEAFYQFRNNDIKFPTPAFMIHLMHLLFFTPMFCDFWIAAWNGMELWKRA